MISIYFITMFEGLKTSTAVSMSAVFTLTPLLTGLFSHISWLSEAYKESILLLLLLVPLVHFGLYFRAALKNIFFEYWKRRTDFLCRMRRAFAICGLYSSSK